MIQKKEGTLNIGILKEHLEVLERHLLILQVLQKNQPAGILKLSELTNYPYYMVRCSLLALEKEGLVEPTHKGTIVTADVKKIITLLTTELKEINKINKTINGLVKKIE
jgi:predicted transcriptional regulator